MDTHAFVFFDNVDVVPQGSSLRFGVIPDDVCVFCIIPHAFGNQSSSNLLDQRFYLGLHAVDVEILGIYMAVLAGRNVWFIGMAGIRTHVAGYTGVCHL